MKDIELDIFAAASQTITPKELSDKLKDTEVFEIEPEAMEQLKKMGITPEQLIERMRSGDLDTDQQFIQFDESKQESKDNN